MLYKPLWTWGTPCFRGGDLRGQEVPLAIARMALALQSLCLQILFWGFTPILIFAFFSAYDANL